MLRLILFTTFDKAFHNRNLACGVNVCLPFTQPLISTKNEELLCLARIDARARSWATFGVKSLYPLTTMVHILLELTTAAGDCVSELLHVWLRPCFCIAHCLCHRNSLLLLLRLNLAGAYNREICWHELIENLAVQTRWTRARWGQNEGSEGVNSTWKGTSAKNHIKKFRMSRRGFGT